MNEESLLSLLILIASMLLLSYLLHFILDKFRMPNLLAPLLVGFLFKLTPIPLLPLNAASGENFYTLSQLGIIFLLFLVGLQLDLKELRSLSTHIGALSTLNLGISTALGAMILLSFGYPLIVSILVATALATVAETTIAPILDELGVIKTRISNLILIPGVIDDVAEVAVASLASLMIGTMEASTNPSIIVFGLLIFLSLALLFQRVLLPLMVRYDENPKDPHLFLLIISTTLIFTFISLHFHLGLLLGSIVSGMMFQKFLRNLNADGKTLTVFKAITYGFLGPIFFFGIGLSMSFSDISTSLSLTLLLLAANFIGKFASALIVRKKANLSYREAFLVGLGSSAKFSMGIIPIQIFFSARVIDQTVFSAFVAVSTITTMIVPFTLAYWIEKWKRSLHVESESCKGLDA